MECPYCRGQLEPGKLYASFGGATCLGYWYPAGTKPLELPTAGRLKKLGGPAWAAMTPAAFGAQSRGTAGAANG